ncbi:MAG: DUF1223 domain-containing protein [Hyphomicrobiales bacterium]|nr:DUF1223 domain-containing protein [Hyphomicrobiales bacterium]MDE2016883.1 DUF1223 domain-containing protein [Hyphomicrobiales bacterium]
MRRPLALLASIFVAVAPGAQASAAPVDGVVELFTSQGCSSCPPADRLAAKLAREPGLLVLSLPVTYWDYLGWKDTLAQPAYTARQRAYAASRGDGDVYTPQAVIDGLSGVVGSEEGSIRGALASGAAKGAARVAVKVAASGDRLGVDVGAGPGAVRSSQVWLVSYAKARSVAIGRGENRGASVTYVNVVRAMTRLGAWNGKPAHFEATLAQARAGGGDAYAVLVQAGDSGRPGEIYGAAAE